MLQRLSSSGSQYVDYFINDGVRKAETWIISVATISFIISVGWLLISNSVSPGGDTHARSRLGLWFLGLFLVAAAGAGLGWWRFVHKLEASYFSDAFLTPLLISSAIGVVIAYYLGCSLGIKPAMRPSVPFANAWLR